jgi:NADH-quinone oxidoreductase subunit H
MIFTHTVYIRGEVINNLASIFYDTFISILKILLIVVCLLISVAYFTLAERKILGAIQRRRGPNVVGVYGLLQPLSDGFKLFVKETVYPSNANIFLFVISPMITFIVSLIGWGLIPFSENSYLSELNNVGLLYVIGNSALGVYGIIMSGWSSNSKYAFLGALRSTAQMVSYEISISFIFITIVMCCGSFNPNTIVAYQEDCWFVITFFPLFLIFFSSALAETNRHPFDLPEAEAELVSGYNVEYSAMGFALFSLGEYANMLMMSVLNTILFFGGWQAPFAFLTFIPGFIWFSLKVGFFVILYVVMRACLPRYRYDQLMSLGWNTYFPISLGYLLFTVSVLITFDMLPY